jgi:hypothetical protein
MIRPNTDLLKSQLLRIESEVNDDLLLLQEGGINYFSTEELRDLVLYCYVERKKQQRLHYLSIGFLITSATTQFSTYVLQNNDFALYAQNIRYFVPIFAATAFFMQFQLRKKPHNSAALNNYRQLILQEIKNRRRQKDASFS